MDRHDGTEQHGRKGTAYDWQSIYVAAHTADLDAELAALLTTPADRA